MYPLPTPSPNPILEDSVLGSKFFSLNYLFNQGYAFFYRLFLYLISDNFRNLAMTVLFFLSMFFLTIISYCAVRLFEIRKKEKNHLQHEIEEYAHHQAEREKKLKEGEEVSKNPRWLKTLNFLFSQHASDWKLAVIEADAMLEDLMGELGFKGENLGDRLKAATQENFRNLTTAWEVHTIRNRIAHEGASFELSQHETKRVIALYEQIFRQYGYI